MKYEHLISWGKLAQDFKQNIQNFKNWRSSCTIWSYQKKTNFLWKIPTLQNWSSVLHSWGYLCPIIGSLSRSLGLRFETKIYPLFSNMQELISNRRKLHSSQNSTQQNWLRLKLGTNVFVFVISCVIYLCIRHHCLRKSSSNNWMTLKAVQFEQMHITIS